MPGGQIAACDYTPAGWPEGSYCIVRRVKLTAARISADLPSRRGRTIPTGQLALALGAQAEHAWAAASSSRTSRSTTARTSSGWKPGFRAGRHPWGRSAITGSSRVPAGIGAGTDPGADDRGPVDGSL